MFFLWNAASVATLQQKPMFTKNTISTSFNFFINEEDQLQCQQILTALAASVLGSSLPKVIQETLAIFATGEWNEICHNEKCRARISVLKIRWKF